MPKVIIDGVEYVPISNSNPSAEHIARGIMELFWGEIPQDKDWKSEASELFVNVQEDSFGNPSVMDVVGRILKRMTVNSERK